MADAVTQESFKKISVNKSPKRSTSVIILVSSSTEKTQVFKSTNAFCKMLRVCWHVRSDSTQSSSDTAHLKMLGTSYLFLCCRCSQLKLVKSRCFHAPEWGSFFSPISSDWIMRTGQGLACRSHSTRINHPAQHVTAGMGLLHIRLGFHEFSSSIFPTSSKPCLFLNVHLLYNRQMC